MTAPDISVVMGVYNGTDYLRETVESVLGQKDVSIEFVIVNDGSTDETSEILSAYSKNDRRVKVLNEQNQGLTSSLIKGCAIAKGRYIARQDVGDVSAPERLRLQKSLLDAHPQTAFVSSWTTYFGPDWENLFTLKSAVETAEPMNVLPKSKKNALINGPTHHGSVMFRKTSYLKAGGYRSQFYFAQDFDLWLRLAEIGLFQMVEAPLYRARITPASISSANKRPQELLATLAWHAFRARERGDSEHQILERAARIRPARGKNSSHSRSKGNYFIGETLRRNNDDRARAYLSRAVKDFPLSVRPWLRLAQARFSK